MSMSKMTAHATASYCSVTAAAGFVLGYAALWALSRIPALSSHKADELFDWRWAAAPAQPDQIICFCVGIVGGMALLALHLWLYRGTLAIADTLPKGEDREDGLRATQG